MFEMFDNIRKGVEKKLIEQGGIRENNDILGQKLLDLCADKGVEEELQKIRNSREQKFQELQEICVKWNDYIAQHPEHEALNMMLCIISLRFDLLETAGIGDRRIFS